MSWPIIVKFAGYKVRNRIFKTKKNLKGKKCEHYGKPNEEKSNWIEKIDRNVCFRNAWSHDGQVLFSDVNDRNKVKVFYEYSRRKRERKRMRLFCLLYYTFSEFWGFCTVLLLIIKKTLEMHL